MARFVVKPENFGERQEAGPNDAGHKATLRIWTPVFDSRKVAFLPTERSGWVGMTTFTRRQTLKFNSLVAASLLCVLLSPASASELDRLNRRLQDLLLEYTDRHPDVVYIRNEIERLEKAQTKSTDGENNVANRPGRGATKKVSVPGDDSPSEQGAANIRSMSGTNDMAPPYFSFTKQGTLLPPSGGIPRPGPYFPTIVSMQQVANFPFDFALYFSTDHHSSGGIWLYGCDRKYTNSLSCKSYDQAVIEGDFDYLAAKPPGNPIFRDTVQGSSTETPHANVINNTVYMTYHNKRAGRNQSTLLALSTDGVNFHRVNGKGNSVILDYRAGDGPGDGHTGYFRWGPNPFSGNTSRYVGYSLHGGKSKPNFALWVSDDAVRWRRHAILKRQRMIENDGFIGWPDPNSVRNISDGEFVAISSGGPQSHGRKKRHIDIYEIFLSADGTSHTRIGGKIIPAGPPGSADELAAASPAVVNFGDSWFIVYLGVAKNRLNSIQSAVGTIRR